MGFSLGIPLLLLLVEAQSVFKEEDLEIPKCRTNGISLIKVNSTYLFNYTTAEVVCKLLGLSLASVSQIAKAHQNGYETCSYGWVSDGAGIISRIQQNPKCGQNNTGIVRWFANFSKTFHAYCFNSSDIWINSCKPDSTATAATNPLTKSASTWAITSATLKPVSRDSSTILQILKPAATKCVNSKGCPVQFPTASSLPTEGTNAEIPEILPTNKAVLLSDRVIFGGLPTALLVLALVFFAVAAALGVCYVKKYMEKVPISSKKRPQEDVETKLFNETTTGDNNTTDKEQKNGKPMENLEKKPAATAQCVEEEV